MAHNERSLRVISPSLYSILIDEFKKAHIHPYDIELSAVKQSEGVLVIIRYGEQFLQSSTHLFKKNRTNKLADEDISYLEEIVAACKRMLMADYYKMMKP
ncbi:hypothetical protein GCM10011391_31420 [Pullulanibacillus camelliae]|uniref:Uncharacterized protein n=1 Tax=Pullulanibacillus camelliae TaxID=1707096 RepID=A0A8J3DYQ3_9BACL|nr:hypothetical protein [Pullulanibacillus camelliae]GGE50397.1 hypothetical protein GCM10011391_31420 [Pullulanibacillus camelliae]